MASFTAHLHSLVEESAIYDVLAIEASLSTNAINLADYFIDLLLQVAPVCRTVRVICCLNREFADALHHIHNVALCAFSDSEQGQRVVGIFRRHVETADLSRHALSNGKASSIVGCGIDRLTRREAGHSGL